MDEYQLIQIKKIEKKNQFNVVQYHNKLLFCPTENQYLNIWYWNKPIFINLSLEF